LQHNRSDQTGGKTGPNSQAHSRLSDDFGRIVSVLQKSLKIPVGATRNGEFDRWTGADYSARKQARNASVNLHAVTTLRLPEKNLHP